MSSMQNLTLQRLTESPNGTWGVLFEESKKPLCWTLELPWKNNARNVSCIPPGAYKVVKRQSKAFKGWVCELQDVPGRDGVLIHPGNTVLDIRGCILVGLQLGELVTPKGTMEAVVMSRSAMTRLLDSTGMEFSLEIFS